MSNWVAFANDILAKNGGGVKMLETLETMGLLRSFKFKIPSNLHLGVSKTDFEGRAGILSQGASAGSLLYIFPMNTFHRQDCSSSLILRTAEFCNKVLRFSKVNFVFLCFAVFLTPLLAVFHPNCLPSRPHSPVQQVMEDSGT